MGFDLLGFLVLFFALVILGLMQAAGALGAMYVLHQKQPLPELLKRWGAIVAPATFSYAIFSWVFFDAGQILVIFTMAFISFPILAGLYFIRDQVVATIYCQFDFENPERGAFNELVVRLALIFLPLTMVVHLFQYVVLGRLINKYTFLIYFTLFVLEVAGIAAGFIYVIKLDRQRTLILSSVSAILYIVILWYLMSRKMLF